MIRFFAVDTRKFLALLGAMFAFTLLAACSSKKPENTVKSYLQAVADKRFEDATMCLTPDDVKGDDLLLLKEKLPELLNHQYMMIKENDGLKSLSLKFVDKNDDIAHADVKIEFINDKTIETHMTLIRESGKWKIKLEKIQVEQF